jgi:hypothetical protein
VKVILLDRSRDFAQLVGQLIAQGGASGEMQADLHLGDVTGASRPPALFLGEARIRVWTW